MLVVHCDVVLPLFRNIVFRENRGYRAGRFASAAVDAFGGMNVEHRRSFEFGFILLREDAVHWTGVDTSRVLRIHAWFADDVGHRCLLWLFFKCLQALRKGKTIIPSDPLKSS